jgi:ornithine cyclodeaminase/alanine dehydrogenase-like protein (mu-crystallin family)
MGLPRPAVAVFQEEDVVSALPLDAAVIAVIESVFARAAAGDVCMPPLMQILARDFGGQSCIKGAWIAGFEYFAVKLASIYPRQPGADAAEANGMFVLLESATGRVKACLLDNGYLTQLRTAAAGAVVAQHLAPASVEIVGVIGAGKQALWQIRAAHLVRPFERVVVWSRRAEQAAALVRRVESLLPVSVRVVAAIGEAVAPAQLVITTTSSRDPLLYEAHLHPNLHITALGSDAKGKRELADDLLRKVDLYVADNLDQCRAYGELQTASTSDIRNVATLGDIVCGKVRGRIGDHQTSIADLTGVGVQDTAIAIEAYRRLTATCARSLVSN